MRTAKQDGFTLLELLVVTAIIAVLLYLGLTSFWVYRTEAAYSVANTVMRNSRVAVEAAMNDLDHPPLAASLVQRAAGQIQDSAGKTYLPQMQLPINVKLTASYDPSCTVGGCQSDFIEVRHCLGKEYVQWVRFGDGVETQIDHIQGSGCS